MNKLLKISTSIIGRERAWSVFLAFMVVWNMFFSVVVGVRTANLALTDEMPSGSFSLSISSLLFAVSDLYKIFVLEFLCFFT